MRIQLRTSGRIRREKEETDNVRPVERSYRADPAQWCDLRANRVQDRTRVAGDLRTGRRS
jgi:hypothetical protein